MYIKTTKDLKSFVNRIKERDVIAIDTEFIRDKTYFAKLCLIQIATRNGCALVDAIQIEDLSSIGSLLEDESITKVFHAATQDIEVLREATGVIPQNVFDTQIAAAFLGFKLQPGLSSLIEHYTGNQLSKAQTLTNWAHRPLDPAQIEYALDDVRYLLEMYDKMKAELEERGRVDWLKPEIEDLLDNYEPLDERPANAYKRVKKVNSLSRRQLAVAREVAAWRELHAMKVNLPRRAALSDELVVEISKRMPTSIEALNKIRGTENIAIAERRKIIQAVKRGLEIPDSELPVKYKRSKPSADLSPVVDLMYATVRIVSEQSDIASQMIATRDHLQKFAEKGKGPLAHGWRYELMGSKLERLLEGEIGLSVSDGRVIIKKSGC